MWWHGWGKYALPHPLPTVAGGRAVPSGSQVQEGWSCPSVAAAHGRSGRSCTCMGSPLGWILFAGMLVNWSCSSESRRVAPTPSLVCHGVQWMREIGPHPTPCQLQQVAQLAWGHKIGRAGLVPTQLQQLGEQAFHLTWANSSAGSRGMTLGKPDPGVWEQNWPCFSLHTATAELAGPVLESSPWWWRWGKAGRLNQPSYHPGPEPGLPVIPLQHHHPLSCRNSVCFFFFCFVFLAILLNFVFGDGVPSTKAEGRDKGKRELSGIGKQNVQSTKNQCTVGKKSSEEI